MRVFNHHTSSKRVFARCCSLHSQSSSLTQLHSCYHPLRPSLVLSRGFCVKPSDNSIISDAQSSNEEEKTIRTKKPRLSEVDPTIKPELMEEDDPFLNSSVAAQSETYWNRLGQEKLNNYKKMIRYRFKIGQIVFLVTGIWIAHCLIQGLFDYFRGSQPFPGAKTDGLEVFSHPEKTDNITDQSLIDEMITNMSRNLTVQCLMVNGDDDDDDEDEEAKEEAKEQSSIVTLDGLDAMKWIRDKLEITHSYRMCSLIYLGRLKCSDTQCIRNLNTILSAGAIYYQTVNRRFIRKHFRRNYSIVMIFISLDMNDDLNEIAKAMKNKRKIFIDKTGVDETIPIIIMKPDSNHDLRELVYSFDAYYNPKEKIHSNLIYMCDGAGISYDCFGGMDAAGKIARISDEFFSDHSPRMVAVKKFVECIIPHFLWHNEPAQNTVLRYTWPELTEHPLHKMYFGDQGK